MWLVGLGRRFRGVCVASNSSFFGRALRFGELFLRFGLCELSESVLARAVYYPDIEKEGEIVVCSMATFSCFLQESLPFWFQSCGSLTKP